MQMFLWLPKNAKSLSISYLQSLIEKHAIIKWGKVKLSEHGAWAYLKANGRCHGTLHTLPKLPPSVDSGNWLIAG